MPSAAELLTLIEYYFETWGLWLVLLGAFLENSVILGFIFPGVTVILLSGFVARTSGESIWLLVFLATIGALFGDNLDYFIGRRFGRILENKPLFARPLRKIGPFLRKYGIYAVFIGRFSGWSRAWIALGCGAVGFGYFKFVLVSAFSALVWTSAWIVGGYLLGGNRDLIEEWLGRTSLVAWVVFGGIIIYYFRTRIRLVVDLLVFSSKKYGSRVKSKFKRTP